MNLKKVIGKNVGKKLFFVGIFKFPDERAGSGSASQWYESTDPYPHQNVTEPHH
jgi:hypothetical protein